MFDRERAAQEAIRAAYARPVSYTGAGIDPPLTGVLAIRSDIAGQAFQGPGDTVRQISFEIDQSDLPRRPRKGDTLTEESGAKWKANDVTDLDDVGAWRVIVEEAQT
jgi:hypothetical protein